MVINKYAYKMTNIRVTFQVTHHGFGKHWFGNWLAADDTDPTTGSYLNKNNFISWAKNITRPLTSCNNTESLIIPPPNKVGGDSPCLSVRPSVCRRHGFRSISQVCFGISISNFTCMLMVAIGRSLMIFSYVTFEMAVWRPYWIFWFPDSNFTLALNINYKLQRHTTYVYG